MTASKKTNKPLTMHLRDHALSLPEAWEDHPWGEVVVKVGKKVFVFLGMEATPGMTVKLPDPLLREHALSLPAAEPSGYGLGKSGWVTIPLRTRAPKLEVLEDFIDESYRAVAPKRLVKAMEKGVT